MPNKHFLIDTHTHFDDPVFDEDRVSQAQAAYAMGVHHLVLIGYLHRYFERLLVTQKDLNAHSQYYTGSVASDNASRYLLTPITHIALGLHPFYIEQHTEANLFTMAKRLESLRPIAIGEIGLDAFTQQMRQPKIFAKQQQFFIAQLDMAVTHKLPVMLHIRKAHAEALAILKSHTFDARKLGGIAHSFSGGVQEAKAFAKIGFKLGVTGQITNLNAKKLRRAIQAVVDDFGIGCLVIETDCPDMTPIQCISADKNYRRNVPANLPCVLSSLSELLEVDIGVLAKQLWQNSCDSLRVSWPYPEPALV